MANHILMLAKQIEMLREDLEAQAPAVPLGHGMRVGLEQLDRSFDYSETTGVKLADLALELQRRAHEACDGVENLRLRSRFKELLPIGLNFLHDLVEVVPRVLVKDGRDPHPDEVRALIGAEEFGAAVSEIASCGSYLGGEIKSQMQIARITMPSGRTCRIKRMAFPGEGAFMEHNFTFSGDRGLAMTQEWVGTFREIALKGEPSGGCPAQKILVQGDSSLMQKMTAWAIGQYQAVEIPIRPSDWTHEIGGFFVGREGHLLNFPLTRALYREPRSLRV